MATLHDINRRINSVKSTKQITRTMEMISAAKIRRARDRVERTIPYTAGMASTVTGIIDRVGASANPLLRVHDEVKHILVVTIVSDRGLAGGFNGNVLRAAERIMKEKAADGITADVIACGKKAISFWKYRKITPIMEFIDLSADPTMGEAIQLGNFAMEKYVDGTYDEVILVYNHARNAGDQVLRAEYLLPVRRIVFVDTSRAIPNWLAPMSAFVSMVDLNNLQETLATGEKAEEHEHQHLQHPSDAVEKLHYIPLVGQTDLVADDDGSHIGSQQAVAGQQLGYAVREKAYAEDQNRREGEVGRLNLA